MDSHQRRAWTVAIASLLLLTIGTGAPYVVVVGMIPIADGMGWPRFVPSTAYALALLGMGAGGILMGRWSDRIGVGRPALVGVLSIALGAWVASRAESAWVLLFANGVLIGTLGNAALFAPLMANTTRWFTRNRGVAVGIVSAGQTLGGAAWPPLHRYLIDAAGWRTTYLVYAAVVLVCATPLTLALRRRPPPDYDAPAAGPVPPGAPTGARVLGYRPGAVHAALCLAIIGCCVAMSMPMVHVIAHASDLGHPAARAAEILALLLFTAFLSRLLWGMLADRIGGLPTLAISSGAQALMLSSYLVVDGLVGLYVVSALYGLAYGGIVPTYSVIVREHFPVGQLGWRIGVIYLFGTIGMALGGIVGGFLFDLAGNYFTAFAVGVAFNVANLAIVIPLALRVVAERRRAASAAASAA